MCGIAGLWAPASGRRGEKAAIATRLMADAIVHRGPDGEGYWQDQEAGIALAHRRLSILDVSPAGHQPMASGSQRFQLTFNGEIYNHLELREELERSSLAPVWRGHSDTETLLACIDAWGLSRSLKRLCGMFAFALWDRKTRTLSLARDRMGEKPLYYGWVGKTLIFASELKALRAFPEFEASIDRSAVAAFLRFSYVPWPHTIYTGVKKLPPASVISFRSPEPSNATDVEPIAYWELGAVAEAGTAVSASRGVEPDYNDRIEELERVLSSVVASQMLSDVPLGAFLSGGIDSSLITALMQTHSSSRVRTFSIGFEDARFNETVHARAVAQHLGTDHTEFVVRESDALALVPELPRIFDEPFADNSQLPTVLVSRLTRQSVTVALSGDGGDEVFGGYNKYLFAPSIWRQVSKLPRRVRALAGPVSGVLQRLGTASGAGPLTSVATKMGLPITTIDRMSKFGSAVGNADTFEDFYRQIASTWPRPDTVTRGCIEASSFLDDAPSHPALPSRAETLMALDAMTYLPDDILVKVDRSAMSCSLETRAPLLDVRVVEHAWQMPLSSKINGRTGKRILRDILDRHIPRPLMERPKQGFAIPIDSWLRGGLRDWADALLSRENLENAGLFHVEAVRNVWARHLEGRDNAGQRLWAVLMLLSWLEHQDFQAATHLLPDAA